MIDIIMPFKNVNNYRLKNLKFLLKYYIKNDFNIILVEQDTNTELNEIENDIKHVYFKNDVEHFSLSKCFNYGVIHSNADYLILLDADIYIEQTVLNDIKKIKNENRLVILYDTNVIMLNENITNDLITKHVLYYNVSSVIPFLTVGGARFISRVSYYKIGGNDENFIGWGGEDNAFYIKSKKLLGITRTNNKIYHMYHPKNTPVVNKKDKKEYLRKIRKMPRKEFNKYIEQQQNQFLKYY